MRSEERSEKQNEYYFQENQQNMHNLQNMKYIDPCFQGIGLMLYFDHKLSDLPFFLLAYQNASFYIQLLAISRLITVQYILQTNATLYNALSVNCEPVLSIELPVHTMNVARSPYKICQRLMDTTCKTLEVV